MIKQMKVKHSKCKEEVNAQSHLVEDIGLEKKTNIIKLFLGELLLEVIGIEKILILLVAFLSFICLFTGGDDSD